MRTIAIFLGFLLAASDPVQGAGVQLVSGEADLDSALRAVESSVDRDTQHQRAGKPVVRWFGIRLESRLEFLHSKIADFEGTERFSLWIHSGTMQGKSLTLVATDKVGGDRGSFYFRLMLTWAGWHRMELSKLRFSRRGVIRWPQVKAFFMEYTDEEGGELFIDDVRLLAPGETLETPDPGKGVEKTDKGEKIMLADFEKGPRSLVRWVARHSEAEISSETVRMGQGALRWSKVKKGSSLEFLQGPFSLTGFDRVAMHVFVTREVAKGLYIGVGNDADRLAFADLGPLEAGWNRIILALNGFITRGRLNESYVDHMMFLFEGQGEITVLIDDVCLIAPPGERPVSPGGGPGHGPKDATLVRDDDGNIVVAGPGVTDRPQPAASRIVHTSEKWYTREGRKSIRWYELEESAELHFRNVPESTSSCRCLEAWVYADAPAGALGITLVGDRGEAWVSVELDWIGWKRLELELASFEGVQTMGPWKEIMFHFEGKEGNRREFFFDRILLKPR
ncbi:MAG: hypothetical protein ACYS47_03900 [Planctomycetota bacterium]